MGPRLRVAKVVDLNTLQRRGGTVKPGMDSIVLLRGPAPTTAAPFVVLRAWDDLDGAFTERWHLQDPHGRTVREPVEREVLPGLSELADEIEDQYFEYADNGYELVLEVDGRVVARADFPVGEAEGIELPAVR